MKNTTDSAIKIAAEKLGTEETITKASYVFNTTNDQSDTANLKFMSNNRRSVQVLVAERLKYTSLLQINPNNFEAHEALALIDEEVYQKFFFF